MDRLVYVVLILAMAGHSMAGGAWCVCKEGVGDANLQKTLDYACGNGADCTQIHQNGACYNPSTVRAHCNYAVNSYFQKKGQAQGACDFAGTASVTTSDPSVSGCVYPSGSSSTSTGTTPNDDNSLVHHAHAAFVHHAYNYDTWHYHDTNHGHPGGRQFSLHDNYSWRARTLRIKHEHGRQSRWARASTKYLVPFLSNGRVLRIYALVRSGNGSRTG